MRLQLAVLVLLALIATDVRAQATRDLKVGPSPTYQGRTLYGNSWAVVIGINRYQKRELRLQYAVNDARSVRDTLVPLGFPREQIIELLDGDATKVRIQNVLGDVLRTRTKRDDRVLVFFAGHGVTIDTPDGAAVGYLLPVDADPDRLHATAIPMTEIRDTARLIPAKHVFFAMDACYSGLAATRSAPQPRSSSVDPFVLVRGRLRQILTAGDRDQPVLEEGGHGLFTKRLLEGLSGEADTNPKDGIITGMELASWLAPRVITTSQNQQTPFFGTMEGVGDFVFVLPESRVAAVPQASEPVVKMVPRQEYGGIRIRANIAGADVWLDDKFLGQTQAGAEMEVSRVLTGAHRLTARIGERTWSATVAVAPDQKHDVFIDLPPAMVPPVEPSSPPPPTSIGGGEIFVPLLVFRTGPYGPIGVPVANGFADYLVLVNERDGGINGVRIAWEECETQYRTDMVVQCYEKLKGKGPTGAVLVSPQTTGGAYQLIPKAAVDKIPVFSTGYGMTAAADGRWFPWVFNFPTTYWSQASAVIRYISQQEGGHDKLKGKKIVHIFHNSPYGKEANPTLETLARQLGFELTLLAVDHPGHEQKSTWLQVRRINPNWIFMSGWGVMNQAAVKEAAAISYPMDRFIGNWWSATEADVVSAGAAAKGYKGTMFHAPGANFRLHQDILRSVYDRGRGAGERARVGETLYNRGIFNAMVSVEAIRTAMARYGNRSLTGEQVRWGLENLNLTEQRLEQLGLKGFAAPFRATCQNHEGSGTVLIQQWDGSRWAVVSDWIAPMREQVGPMLEQVAALEGTKLGYLRRDCARVGGS